LPQPRRDRRRAVTSKKSPPRTYAKSPRAIVIVADWSKVKEQVEPFGDVTVLK